MLLYTLSPVRWICLERKLTNTRISSYLQRMEPLRLTPYMDECIRNLSKKAEYPSDKIMACLAKLQMVVGHIPSNCGVQSPIGLYVNALQAQLQAIRKDLSHEFSQNGQPHLQLTLLCLEDNY
jgi:hypothetical protein